MKARYVIPLLLLLYIGLFGIHAALLHKTVYGDGIFYYSWVRSSIVDGDIDFTNDYATFHTSQPIAPSGLPGNKYSIGASILWYPWFLWTHILVRGTGYEPIYQYVIGFVSVLYAVTGLILLYRSLRLHFSEPISTLTLLTIALATNALYYGAIDPVNSHAVSFFAVSVFISLITQRRFRWFQIGCAIGLIALIRTQDIVLAVATLAFIKPKYIPVFLAGILYIFIPQLLVWQIINNAFWKSPYISSIEGFRFLEPHIMSVLFSLQNGLFLWTPITLLGLVGLFLSKKSLPTITFAVTFIVQVLLVSTWSVWWQGASYSGRMFVSSLPLLAFGVAHIFHMLTTIKMTYQHLLISVCIPLSFINITLILYFMITH